MKENSKALIREEKMGWFQKMFSTNSWYDNLKKPSITPPKWAFPVVWTILYCMIGISLIIYINKTGLAYSLGLVFFLVQVALNMAWFPMFFLAKMTTFALIEAVAMWTFILLNIIEFHKTSPPAAYLLVPYLLWVIVAIYLNAYVVVHNPDPFFVKEKQGTKAQ